MKKNEYYNKLRIEAGDKLINRMRLAFNDHPDIESVYREICRASRDNAIHPSNELSAKIDSLQGRLSHLLKMYDYPDDHFSMEYQCALCRDTGIIGESNCVCAQTGAPLRLLENYNLSVFPLGSQRDNARLLLDIISQYIEQYDGNNQPNLLLFGDTGLGKTFALSCIIGELTKKGASTKMLTAYHLIQTIMNDIIGKNDYSFLRYLENIDVLCIDDLGSEPMIPNITMEHMFSLVNERITYSRHTLIATNLSPSEINQKYGQRTTSRLFDVAHTKAIKLTGEDLRLLKQN